MTPEQAESLLAGIAETTARARDLTVGATPETLMNRPRKESWSVAEAIEHLVLTADAMLPLIESAITDLERSGARSAKPARSGFLGWLLVKALEPPPRMKSRTTAPFTPVDVADPLRVAGRFAAANDRLAALVKRAIGLDASKARVVSPFNAKVRYNVYAAFRIMLAHARRHLWQAAEAARVAAA